MFSVGGSDMEIAENMPNMVPDAPLGPRSKVNPDNVFLLYGLLNKPLSVICLMTICAASNKSFESLPLYIRHNYAKLQLKMSHQDRYSIRKRGLGVFGQCWARDRSQALTLLFSFRDRLPNWGFYYGSR